MKQSAGRVEKTLNLSPSAETYSVAPREPQPLNVIYSEEALTVSRRLFPKQLFSLLSLCLLSLLDGSQPMLI